MIGVELPIGSECYRNLRQSPTGQSKSSNEVYPGHVNVLFSARSGIRETAKTLGLGDNIKVQLNR